MKQNCVSFSGSCFSGRDNAERLGAEETTGSHEYGRLSSDPTGAHHE